MAEDILELVRSEATKFGRCCDLYQDDFGTFADHECRQRTFAMLRGVQRVLGVDKGGSPLTEEEVSAARARARLNNAAPDLLEALKLAQHATAWMLGHHVSDEVDARFSTKGCNSVLKTIDAAIAKAEGGKP